jgi:hypothetical protein
MCCVVTTIVPSAPIPTANCFSDESHEAGLTDLVIRFVSVGVSASLPETP